MKRATLLTVFLITSCFNPIDEGELEIKLARFTNNKAPSISNVQLNNDQLIVTGANLLAVNSVVVDSNPLTILSKTKSSLVLSAASKVNLLINTSLNLIISSAYGAATVSVTFNLVDGSVSASKIGDGEIGTNHFSAMGASVGQVLKYDGTNWVASDLGSLTYAGNWNANTNVPDLTGGGQPGEYYIVTTAGVTDLLGGSGTDDWQLNDWAIWNSVLARWEKVNNSSTVVSFNGRQGAITPQTGDYTWAQINKSTSSISDLADVDTTGIANGKVLKWDGSNWVIGDDETTGVGTVDSMAIQDGSVADVDLAGGISQTKISGLPALATQVTTNTTGISNNATALVGKEPILSAGALGQYYRGDKSWQTLDSDAVSEGTNLYHTQARARSAAVVNSTAGNETDKASSVASMKSYVSSQISGLGGGDFMADGSVAMSGDFDLGNNKITNAGGSFGIQVANDGHVGIGASPNGNDLVIYRNGVGSPTLQLANSSSGAFNSDGAQISLNGSVFGFDHKEAGGIFRFNHNGNVAALEIKNDKVAINAYANNANFEISKNGQAGSIPFIISSDDDNNGDILIVNSAGNLGLGRTSPGSKLDVNGGIRATQICDESGANCKDISTGWGSGGEVNTASSIGAGQAVYKTKSGVDLQFKSIIGGSGITASGNADDISLSVTEGDLDITNMTGTLPLSRGGTGATTAGAARTNLGLGSAALVDIGSSTGEIITSNNIPNCLASQKLQMSAGPVYSWSCISDQTIADTNTNAQTICAAGEYLDGAGLCNTLTSGATSINGLSDGRVVGNSVFLGPESGGADDGTNNKNTGVGRRSLRNVTSGANNVAVGHNAGSSITTGSNNIVIGLTANPPNATDNDRLNIGNTIYGDMGANNIGIGVISPEANLDVNGSVRGRAISDNAGTKDFATGNIQYTTENCGFFNLHNMKNGGAYTFIVQGGVSLFCAFAAYSDSGTTALTVHMPPNHAPTEAGKHTLYSMIVAGDHVYVSWVTGL